MLESITIRNLILIKEEEIGLTAGLNILSGETGAGKSVIIGSILMALGGRAEKDVIRRRRPEPMWADLHVRDSAAWRAFCPRAGRPRTAS